MNHYADQQKIRDSLLVFLISISVTCFLPAQELKPAPDKNELIKLPVPLLVNGNFTRTVFIYIAPSTEELVYISAQDIIGFLAANTTIIISDTPTDNPARQECTIKDLERLGISSFFDVKNLILSINIPYEMLKPEIIEISSQRNPYTADIISPESFSGWLNIFTSQNMNMQSALDDSPEYLAFFTFELGLNIQNFITESRFSFDTDPDTSLQMPEITVSHDWQAKRLRITAGHYTLVPRFFQTGGTYQGISVTWHPAFDPSYRQYRNDDLHFTLETESVVELWLNGRKLRTFRLSPGHYNLSDFPVYSGLNTVEIHILDGNGQRRILENSVPYDSGLVSRGQQKFSYSAGILPWEPVTDFIFSGYHTFGITNYFNIGLQVQSTLDHFTGGTSLLIAMPFGSLLAAAAFSITEWENFGWSTELTYRLTGNSKQYLPVISFSARYSAEEFRIVNSEESSRLYVSGNINQKLSKQLSARLKCYYCDYWNGSDASSGIDLSFNIYSGPSLFIGIQARTSLIDPSPDESSLTVTLQLRDLERNSSASHVQDVVSGQPVLTLQKAFPEKKIDSSVMITGPGNPENSNYSGQGSLRYSGNRFNSSVYALYEKNSSGSIQSASFNFSTGIVFAGPEFGLTSPVTDSFLIVVPEYDLKDRTLGINNTGLTYESRSDFFGPLVISSLSSYKYKQIHIDLLDQRKDPSVFLKENDFILFPLYHSGLLLHIGNRPSTDLNINFSDTAGKPLIYLGGSVQPIKDPQNDQAEEILFFTDENGLAIVYSLQEGNYRFTIPGYKAIEIPIDIDEEKTSDIQQITVILEEGE